jgi:hypothetical protein
MHSKPDKPYFYKRIFWDVDAGKLDYEGQAAFIIVRVFERGDVEDIRYCRRYYGDEHIRGVLLDAKYLPEMRISLASAILNEPLNAFRAYNYRQSNPGLSPY